MSTPCSKGGAPREEAPSPLPYSFKGTVVRGFGRGGKQLGCPTANMDASAVAALPPSLPCGVYWGTGQVEGIEGSEAGFVMSIGYNPQFDNQEKTMEVHFLRDLSDFYGGLVSGTIRGFLREMKSFAGLDELIAAIEKDKSDARRLLEETARM